MSAERSHVQRGASRHDEGIIAHGALAGTSALVANVATYGLYAAAARVLGVADQGAFLSLIAGALMLSVPFGVLGLGVSGLVARMIALGRTESAAVLIWRTAVAYSVVALFVLIAGTAAAPALASFFHSSSALAIVAASVVLVVNGALLLMRGAIQGVADFGGLALSNVTEAVAKSLAAVAIVRLHADVKATIVLFGCAVGAAFVPGAILLARRLYPLGAGKVTLQDLVYSVGPVLVAMGAITVMTFFDAIAARHYLDGHEAGLYNTSALAGRALMTVLAFMPAVLFPKIAARNAVLSDTRRVGLIALLVTVAVCVVAGFVFIRVPQAIALVLGGRAYIGAAAIIPAYGIASASLAAATVVATYHAGRSRFSVGIVMVVVMLAEISCVIAFHDSARTIVTIAATGHSTALALGAIAGWWSSRVERRRVSRASRLAGSALRIEGVEDAPLGR